MENKPDKVFVDGLSFFEPREGAPDFVKGTLSIQVEKFNEFLKNHLQYIGENGYMKLDVKKSQKGNCYVEVNTYKKSEQQPTNEPHPGDDIPFSSDQQSR